MFFHYVTYGYYILKNKILYLSVQPKKLEKEKKMFKLLITFLSIASLLSGPSYANETDNSVQLAGSVQESGATLTDNGSKKQKKKKKAVKKSKKSKKTNDR